MKFFFMEENLTESDSRIEENLTELGSQVEGNLNELGLPHSSELGFRVRTDLNTQNIYIKDTKIIYNGGCFIYLALY